MAAAQDGIDGLGRIQPGAPVRAPGGPRDSGASPQRQPPRERAPEQPPHAPEPEVRPVRPKSDGEPGGLIDEMA